jgi:hypothetical protein
MAIPALRNEIVQPSIDGRLSGRRETIRLAGEPSVPRLSELNQQLGFGTQK